MSIVAGRWTHRVSDSKAALFPGAAPEEKKYGVGQTSRKTPGRLSVASPNMRFTRGVGIAPQGPIAEGGPVLGTGGTDGTSGSTSFALGSRSSGNPRGYAPLVAARGSCSAREREAASGARVGRGKREAGSPSKETGSPGARGGGFRHLY